MKCALFFTQMVKNYNINIKDILGYKSNLLVHITFSAIIIKKVCFECISI